MDVHALSLINVCATVSSKVEDLLLTDLPDGLVDSLDIVRNAWDVLN